MNGIAALAKLGQHGHDPVEQSLRFLVFLSRKGSADFQNILRRAALQCRAPSNFEVTPAIAIRRLSIALGNVQRNSLRGPQDLILGVAMPFQGLAIAISPADVFDGCPIYVEFFMPKTHVFFSFVSIPIPIPTPTPMVTVGDYKPNVEP